MWAILIRSDCLLIVFHVIYKIFFTFFFVFFHISSFVFLLSLLAFLFISYTFSHVSYTACYFAVLLYSKPVSLLQYHFSSQFILSCAWRSSLFRSLQIIRHYQCRFFFHFVLIFFCSLFILISQLNSTLWPWLEIFLLSLIFRTYLEDELAKAKSKPRKVSTT